MNPDEDPPYTKRELYLSDEMMKQARYNTKDDSLALWVRALIRDARKETSKEYELQIAKIIKRCNDGECEELKKARDGYVTKEELGKLLRNKKHGLVDIMKNYHDTVIILTMDEEKELSKLLEEK